jgi:thioredoxin 1
VQYGIRGIPTLLIFKGGKVVEQIVGFADKQHLKKVIDKHL